jgi:hypothetical protein
LGRHNGPQRCAEKDEENSERRKTGERKPYMENLVEEGDFKK